MKVAEVVSKDAGSRRYSTEEVWDASEALAWDDLTGVNLDARKVKEAMQKEIQYMKDNDVWVEVPRNKAREITRKERNRK